MLDALVQLSPAWPFLIAGLLCLAIPVHLVRKALMLAAPLVGLFLWFLPAQPGVYGVVELGPFVLETFRYDALSRVWGLIFVLAGLLNGVFALHERARVSDGAALLYTGAAIGAVFAGDLLTLFLFWEITAIASAPLIFAAGGRSAYLTGLRYLAIQVLSGVVLLGGAMMLVAETGSWTFGEIGLDSRAGWVILAGVGVKAAFPLLHNWLQDAYPKATATGAVVLSAFTTKMAIYALARAFPGEDILIWVGVVMAVFPVIYITLENDLRRMLAYSLNAQLGFMVAAIGVGGAIGLNAAAANAFVHVLYKGLLFMTMGAVLMRAGTVKATELGGLFRSMPITTVFSLIGCLTLLGAPFLAGFAAKALVLHALLEEGHILAFTILVIAAAGVVEHSGYKLPWFAFFGRDSGKRPAEAPWNMLLAMGLAAFLCVYLGLHHEALFGLLPYPEAYEPYKLSAIIGQLQLIAASLLAFGLVIRFGLYPLRDDRITLDADWLYRRVLDGAARWSSAMTQRLITATQLMLARAGGGAGRRLFNLFSPAGLLSRDFPSGLMALWTALMLAMVLIAAYFSTL